MVANRSIYMSAPTRNCYSEMICILRKIHRLRKHPWISAQTMDPQIAQADPWIAQIRQCSAQVFKRAGCHLKRAL